MDLDPTPLLPGAEWDDREPTDAPRADRPSLRRAAWLGAKRGVQATAAMTAFRLPISRSPPPPSYLVAKLFDGDPGECPVSGMVLHFVYGTVAGSVFGAWFERRASGPDAERERDGVVLGSLYGVALSAFGNRVLMDRLLGLDLDDDERFVFHVSHLVYGLTLGTALGSDE